jgi:diadenosine tetraphosphate (Ap4A) HIT family hydrolase
MSQVESGFVLHPQLEKDCTVVGELALCRVLLMNDANYPWLILVPRRAGLRELHELAEHDLGRFWRESAATGRALMQEFDGDKLNVAALGNVVAQLHVHHIVRHTTDPAWPRPVWGVAPAHAYEEAAREFLLGRLRAVLGTAGLR